MKNKFKLVITVIISFVILSVGVGFIIISSIPKENRSKELIQAINYIKDNNYEDSYNEIKDSSKNEKAIINALYIHQLNNQFSAWDDIQVEIAEEAENITDYLLYSSLYSKNSKYQEEIDKLYATKFSELIKFKETLPRDIMPDDSLKYYDDYFDFLDYSNGLFSNYEYNIINDNTNLLARIEGVTTRLNEVKEESDSVLGAYPTNLIPEEYKILFSN